MYYEVAGEDEPEVLLHGGFGGVHVWTGQVPTLAKRYRVNVPEQRDRGHSPDVEGPITYQGLADDEAGIIERVVGGPTNLVWASDGASHAVFMEKAELLKRPDPRLPGGECTVADDASGAPRPRVGRDLRTGVVTASPAGVPPAPALPRSR